MPLDPQIRTYLDDLATLGLPPITEQTVAEARKLMRDRSAALFGPPDPVADIVNSSIPGPAGPIPVRTFRPRESSPGPLGTLVYFHGGGWVVGDLDTHDAMCRTLSNRSGCQIIAVDYRLAPEHKFPAAVDDAWAATAWIVSHAAELGTDPSRIAVGGDSAGGNLAAVVALRARDRGMPLALQILVYPVTDFRFDTPSYAANGEGYSLTRAAMRWYWSHYLAREADGALPDASPLRAADLQGVAPALVITCEFDVLQDEGESYARRLREAGVAAQWSRYDGLIHGVLRMPAVVDRANDMLGECAAALRSALG